MPAASPRAHGQKNLDTIETTLRKNRESTYTEELTAQHQGFDYAAHAGSPWQAESLSLMAGSPLHEGATVKQKLANREMKGAENLSIGAVLHRNERTFRDFAKGQRDVAAPVG